MGISSFIKRRHFLGGVGAAVAIPSAYADTKTSLQNNNQNITISTHILDLVSGQPASNVAVELYHQRDKLFEGVTEINGRCSGLSNIKQPIIAGKYYQLVFHMAEYFKNKGYPISDPPFLNVIRIDFGISLTTNSNHYHIPLLASPYGFSTYRGS